MDDATKHGRPAASGGPHEVAFLRETPSPPPAVTIIISLYNYERYIVECLESVRHQTAAGLDLIVVDDCSKDHSCATARAWMEENGGRFRRCQLIHHTVNQGLAASRNRAFGLAETEHVFVLDADNTIFPRCIEVLSGALSRCEADFAYGYLEKFGAERGMVSWRPWSREDLRHGNTIDAMAMLRRSTWERVGGYSMDMEVPGWEDYELWLKVGARGGWGILVPEFVARYRVHPSSMLRTLTNPQTTLIWDYLERKHPGVRRPQDLSECGYRDQDIVHACCERARCVPSESGSGSGRPAIEVRGWALARFGIARVDVLVDGRPAGQARYGDLRADLLGRVAGFPNGVHCGFSYRGDLPDGPEAYERTVSVRVTATSGRSVEIHDSFTAGLRALDAERADGQGRAEPRRLARGGHRRRESA